MVHSLYSGFFFFTPKIIFLFLILGTVTFTEKKLLCDAEDMRALSLDMEQKVEEMAFLDRFGALRIQEFNISEMMFRDLIYGCQALFEEYTDALVAPIIYTSLNLLHPPTVPTQPFHLKWAHFVVFQFVCGTTNNTGGLFSPSPSSCSPLDPNPF